MKKSLVLLLAATIGLSACNNFKKGPSGTLYKIHKNAGKDRIKEGDYIKFNFMQYNDKDSLERSTYDLGQPAMFQVTKKTYPGDMNDVLTYFGEGDSATFKIDIDTMEAKGGRPRPAELKGQKYMVFTVKIERVFTRKPGEADSTYAARAGEFFKKEYQETTNKLKSGEPARIKAFETANNLKTTVSSTGLHYVIQNAGTGDKPAAGDTVMVNYTGKLLTKKTNGKDNIFDTTDPKIGKENMAPNPGKVYAPQPLVLNAANTIPGMVEGLMMLGKGGKMTMIIPSSLGFGEMGAPGAIPPYAPLHFDVEVMGIKKATGAVAPPAPVMKR